ncbi:MAG: Fe-only nitrogenase subunit delta [Propionibacteriales bacterium]|nr:Fe-only nitrogenase subunit delta [Propionibacteriales bacterium]
MAKKNPQPELTDELRDEYRELLLDHIMKKCLWQFHSRAWDRERQNENILAMTTELLCGTEVSPATPDERCYYVDAFDLARAYRNKFTWLSELSTDQIREVMAALKTKLDHVTIHGSLNAELTDAHY